MKTIKIIDLLNKIANGEEEPKKIKVESVVYKYDEEYEDYYSEEYEVYLMDKYNMMKTVNKEVEILEEDKENKLEKIQKTFSLYFIDSKIDCKSKDGIDDIINELIKKVDEIVDEVNKLKESK